MISFAERFFWNTRRKSVSKGRDEYENEDWIRSGIGYRDHTLLGFLALLMFAEDAVPNGARLLKTTANGV